MRIIQQKPCWSVHAFLRFNDLRYISESTPAFNALGRDLPVIIDGDSVKSEEELFASCSQNHGGEYLAPDAILSKALRESFGEVFSQMTRQNGDDRERLFKALPIGLSFVYCRVIDAQNIVNGNRFDKITATNDDDFIAYLDKRYGELNNAIMGREAEPLVNVLLNPVTKLSRRDRSDAVLFGHIAEALCHEKLGPVVSQYDSLMAFFLHVCNAYFATPFNAAGEDDDQHWADALNDILSSPFLRGERCDRIKGILTDLPKEPIRLNFTSTKKAGPQSMSPLYLNASAPPAAHTTRVYDFPTTVTRIKVNMNLLPVTLSAVVDKTKTVFGRLTGATTSTTVTTATDSAAVSPVVDFDSLSEEDANQVGVSLGGLIYLGVIAACFAGYVQRTI